MLQVRIDVSGQYAPSPAQVTRGPLLWTVRTSSTTAHSADKLQMSTLCQIELYRWYKIRDRSPEVFCAYCQYGTGLARPTRGHSVQAELFWNTARLESEKGNALLEAMRCLRSILLSTFLITASVTQAKLVQGLFGGE